MRIFVMGARGFIGARVSDGLEAAGHAVERGGRPAFDFARDHRIADWIGRLRDFDLAVNAVGIFRESGTQTFDAIHDRGPRAMFEACAALGIPVVQVSALGADDTAETEFLRSKKRADDALLAMNVPSVVVQPSLVYGEGGASAALFATLASLPLIPLPGSGDERIQPVHVDDLAALVVALVERRRFRRERIAAVGPDATTLRHFLADLRGALGLGRARFLALPEALVAAAARLRLGGMLDEDALRMLRRGNVADASAITQVLGRAPRPVTAFVPSQHASQARREAQLGWLLPVLRLSLAIVWLTAGVVSLGLYPVNESLELLARTGLHGAPAYAALYGASAIDLAFGLATLLMRRRRILWVLQAAVIVGYTAIITLALPEQWLHPYGPVVKNLPILAAILALYTLEKR